MIHIRPWLRKIPHLATLIILLALAGCGNPWKNRPAAAAGPEEESIVKSDRSLLEAIVIQVDEPIGNSMMMGIRIRSIRPDPSGVFAEADALISISHRIQPEDHVLSNKYFLEDEEGKSQIVRIAEPDPRYAR